MIFSGPIPYSEAIAFAQAKGLLPMDLTSSDYALLEQELKQRAVFSARLDKAAVLQVLLDNLTLLVGGTEDEHGRIRSVPEAKAQLREAMFKAGVPLAEVGTPQILDFHSDARRALMIETTVLDTLGFGGWKRGQDSVSLAVNPGLDLVRLRWPKGGEASMRPWIKRWIAAMDSIGSDAEHGCTDPRKAGGRMVALKNHPIWQALGEGAGGYTDSLGNPWPPFAFRSGMGVEPVPREECIELGLMGENETLEPDDSFDLNTSLQARTARFNEALTRELGRGGLKVEDGVLKVANARNKLRVKLLAYNIRHRMHELQEEAA